MSVDAVSSNKSATAPVSNLGQVSRIPSQVLDQDDFLKLVMAQMTAQDPLNPKKDTDFIAQMAQFSALEQSRTMQSDMAQLRSEQQVLQANSLIGRQVTVLDDSKTILGGQVSAVHMLDGSPRLVVGGDDYSLSQVLTIQAPPAATPAAHPTSTYLPQYSTTTAYLE